VATPASGAKRSDSPIFSMAQRKPTGPAPEPKTCPNCGNSWEFGEECPDCKVPLEG
jgi:predicted amidophosphoribosyltransferase